MTPSTVADAGQVGALRAGAAYVHCERCGRHLGWWHPTETRYGSWYCHKCKHHTEIVELAA